ncbi:MAG: tetratricopeptide repeat-containing sensor histidine kinase [Candidatus Delongbacteria bacterium]|nr:tetratricopeptide repeat-containing sensor histidine kinase [Candidatus Delongbacteria bacterium]
MKNNGKISDRSDKVAVSDFEEVKRKLHEDLKDSSGDNRIRTLLDLGSMYLEENKFHDSEKFLLEALKISDNRTESTTVSLLYKNLGEVCLKLFKLSDARNYFLKALELTPEKNKRAVSFIYSGLGDAMTKMTKMDEGLNYYFKSLELRTQLKFWMGISEVMNKIGVNYFYQSDYNKALEYFNQSLKIREKRHENEEAVAACLNNISLACYHKGDYPKALEFCLKTLNIYQRTRNSEKQGMCYNNLGLIYFETSLFSEALECQFKALKLKERTNNPPFIANTLSNIGMIYSRLYNLEKALDYSLKALEMRKSVDDKRGIANSYNDLGRIYDKMNQFGKAIPFFEESVKMRREMNYLSGLSESLENLGMLYLKKNDLLKAETYLLEAKNIAEKMDYKKTVSGIYRNIASLYMLKGMYEEALVYIKRSQMIAEKLGLKDKIRDANKILSEIYGRKNNFKKALGYYVMYSKLNEEILSIEKQNELNAISHKYENYKRQKENENYRIKNAELSRLNKELKRSKNELMKSNSAKDKFFNIIAHDLKNPFSILYTTSEILITYFDELTRIKQKEYIKTINTSTLHLLRLIENLLEWSRTQSGLKNFNPVEFDFSEIVRSSYELLRPNAEFKSIALEMNDPGKVFITGDKNMLKTVIRNLITNAVKFTKPEGRIEINYNISGRRLIFKVTDTGVGIKKKDISKVFAIDKHYSTTGTSNEKGTGIGLLLCKEFIDKHKGKMTAESIFRKGSTFGFELPLK